MGTRAIVRCAVSAVLAALLVGVPAHAEEPRATSAPGNPHHLQVDGATMRDGRDRHVLLRGIAVIDKRDKIPAVDAADFERIRSWGLNSIRLGVFWSATMPAPGVIDDSYVAAVRDVVDLATDAGLYVVLDMHQDLWGHPHGEGAPAWASNTNCPDVDFASYTGSWATNYFSPVVVCAFTNFWLDRDLQDAYGEAWRALAAAVGENPRVAGYDLMNEPYQGLIPPAVFATQYLYPAQSRWISTIREVDGDAIGFFEPPNAKNVHLPTVPPTGLPDGVVYAPHLYGLWDASDDLTESRRLAQANFEYSTAEASVAGTPLWIGEWGVRAEGPGSGDFVRDVLDWSDAALAGSSYWEYSPGNAYSPIGADGVERPLLDALVRAYPWAVAGTIERFHYDAGTSAFELDWRQAATGVSIISAPARLYPDGVMVDGVDKWSYDAEHGWLRITADPGAHRITVTPR